MEEEFNVEKSKSLDYDRLIAENKRKLTTLINIFPVSNKHAIKALSNITTMILKR